MYIMSLDVYYGVSFPVRMCSFVSFSVLRMNTIVLTETTSSHKSSGAKLSQHCIDDCTILLTIVLKAFMNALLIHYAP